MSRNTVGKYARRVVTELSGLCRTHRSAHKPGAHHGNRIDEAEQGSPAGLQTQEYGGKPPTDQRAALNTWEGEGGSTAAFAHEGVIRGNPATRSRDAAGP